MATRQQCCWMRLRCSRCCAGADCCNIDYVSTQEAENFGQNDLEASNTFSGGLSISHIEEDPFVGDFKEEKFIDKI